MVNIQCGRKVAPELFQEEACAENLAREARALLTQPGAKEDMIREFRRLKEDLSTHSPSAEVADMIREMVHG
jgi:lipid A disaccharide synthetase